MGDRNNWTLQLVVVLRALFYAITGTLHFCLLPLLDLSHKSQGYVGDQNQILQLLATAPYLTSNLGQIQVLLRPQWPVFRGGAVEFIFLEWTYGIHMHKLWPHDTSPQMQFYMLHFQF